MIFPATIKRNKIVMGNAGNFCPVSKKFGTSRLICIKISRTKFHVNPPSGGRADTCGETDGRTNSLIHVERRTEEQTAWYMWRDGRKNKQPDTCGETDGRTNSLIHMERRTEGQTAWYMWRDGRKNKQPDTILVDMSAFMAIHCYQQQHN